MNGYSIRSARPEDAEGIRDTHVASIRGLAAQAYSGEQIAAWSVGRVPEDYVKAMTCGGETMFVATSRAGGVVGFAALADDEVRAVYVHPDHARNGVGRLLLRALESLAQDRGLAELRLTSSLNAVAFYRSQGYEEVGRTTFELRGGIGLRCAAMSKTL